LRRRGKAKPEKETHGEFESEHPVHNLKGAFIDSYAKVADLLNDQGSCRSSKACEATAHID
jgi:hypothetical protein